MCVYQTRNPHLPSRFLSCQQSVGAVPSSMTYFITNLMLGHDFLPRRIGPNFVTLTFNMARRVYRES